VSAASFSALRATKCNRAPRAAYSLATSAAIADVAPRIKARSTILTGDYTRSTAPAITNALAAITATLSTIAQQGLP
jgi:hypothetical protein